MNFYKRYVGDIQRDTGHLSLAEFGAYDRLLDHYYATEMPLPADIDACCRIARAMTKDERKSVINILSQYFNLTEQGYVQKRADKEIAEAKPAMVAARLNGVKGGRPKKDKNETQEKPNGFSENNQSETQHETSPEPEPYYEISNSECKSNAVPNNENQKTHTQIQIGLISEGLTAIGFMPFNPQLPKFMALIQAGATVDEFVNTALEFKGDEEKFNASYLLGTMTKRRQAAAEAKPLHQGAMPIKDYQQSISTTAGSVFKPEYIAEQTKQFNEVNHEQKSIAA